MPRVPLEDWVPYERSVAWRLQDAYFASRGLEAWNGDIPWLGTSNPAAARQAARFFADWAARFRPEGRVDVLEIGGGNGAFCRNAIQGLRRSRRPADRALLARLRWTWTDIDAGNVARMADDGVLAPMVRDGVVRAGVLDATRPDRLVVGGEAEDPAPTIVVANYVCCLVPPRIYHKSALGWLSRRVRLMAPDDDLLSRAGRSDGFADLDFESSWFPADLDAELGPGPAAALREATAHLVEATVVYPAAFLAMLERFTSRGALFLLTDFGYLDTSGWAGEGQQRPVHYGTTLCHPVHFALLDTLWARIGVTGIRTGDPLRFVQAAACARDFDEGMFRRRFSQDYGEDYLDLVAAGKLLDEKQDFVRAARMYQRALRMEPDEPEPAFRFGVACLRAGHPERGLSALLASRGADVEGLDFDYALGRCFAALHQYDDAIRAFEASVQRKPSSLAWTWLGIAHDRAGNRDPAVAAWHEALALDPNDAEAAKRLSGAVESAVGRQPSAVSPVEPAVPPRAPGGAGASDGRER